MVTALRAALGFPSVSSGNWRITLILRKLTRVSRKMDRPECQTEGRETRWEVTAIVTVKNGKMKACIQE